MKRSYIIQITLMLLCILSFPSCSDDSENEPVGDLQINLSKEDVVVEIGSTVKLSAGFSPADAPNKAHTWTSENPQIATVDETGTVTGVSVGTTKIVATALANNATATCIVEVVDKIIAVSSVTLNSKEETISVGSTTQLTATVKPATATDKKVVWSSNDNSVASVDENGLVKGLSEGSANITASAGGKSAVCAITVTEKSVDFSGIQYTVQADGTLLVSGTVTPIGVNVSEIGICLSTETTPTVETNKQVLTTTGLNVHNEIGGLKANTSYFVRMYAKGDGVIYYGKSEVIKIPGEMKTQFKLVENYYAYDHNKNKKRYSLTISTPKVEGYDCSFCYGVAPNPEITDNVAEPTTEGDLQIIKLENLSGATRYYIRAYSLKNNKPIYHSGEANFSTIGAETKLSDTWLGNRKWKIDYTLKEKGTYKVTSNTYNSFIGKTEDAIQSEILYVKNGSGSIYLKYRTYSHDTVTFEHMDSGTLYKIHISY